MARGLSEPESKAAELIGIGLEECDFFTDQHGTAYAFRKNPGHTARLGSREFKVWLVGQFYERHHEAASGEAINAALNVLEAKANASQRLTLSTRCAMEGSSKLLVDLADKDEGSVAIEPGGWNVVSLGSPKFRRYSHMLPMKVASEGADLGEFARFWRLKDQADDVLLVGFIGHAFVSEIPHSILALVGSKGSTKTSATRAIRQIIDPSSVSDLTIGARGKEFVQQLAHHYAPLFDNVSRLQPWQADDLCRASTGAGFSKRGLYTDEEDVIFQFRRVVLINGINAPTKRPDFLDRCILLECARVPRGERVEDALVQEKVSEWLPRLRRTVFDGLAKAIALVPQVRSELSELPRMADFAIWGEAFCRALGYVPLEFYERLMVKVEETSTVALENDIIAELLVKLVEGSSGRSGEVCAFEGSASELLKRVQSLNDERKYVSPKELPPTPDSLGRRLGEIGADLEEAGIRISQKRTGSKRVYSIAKMPPRSGEKASPVSRVSDAGCGAVLERPPTGEVVENNASATPMTHDGSDTSRSGPGEACGNCGGPLEASKTFKAFRDGKELVICSGCWKTAVHRPGGTASG